MLSQNSFKTYCAQKGKEKAKKSKLSGLTIQRNNRVKVDSGNVTLAYLKISISLQTFKNPYFLKMKETVHMKG